MSYTIKALQQEVQKRVTEDGDHRLWKGVMVKGCPQLSLITNGVRTAFQVRRLVWNWAHPNRVILRNERVILTCDHERCISAGCLRIERQVASVKRNQGTGRFQHLSKDEHRASIDASHESFRARAAIRKNPTEAHSSGLITAEEAARLTARNIEKKQARLVRYERIRASGVWMGRGKGVKQVRRPREKHSA